MSTLGRPVSQVMVRSASRSASLLNASMSPSSSRAAELLVGPLALLADARGEAFDQLAGDADDDLASSGNRPSPPLPGGRPGSCRRRRRCRRRCPTACARAPGACGRRRERSPCRPRSISKTSALANSVPTSSAVQAASRSLSARCRKRRQKATLGGAVPVRALRVRRRRLLVAAASARALRGWRRGRSAAGPGAYREPAPSPLGRRRGPR